MISCLAEFDEIPHVRAINLGDFPAQVFAINCKTFKDSCATDLASPDIYALEFYCLNHLMSLVKSKFTRHEHLPEWAATVANAYTTCLMRQGQRLINYMTLITTRESRHVYYQGDFLDQFKAKFGEACVNFNGSIKGSNSSQAVNAFLDSPPEAPLGLYLSSLEFAFNEGKFSGGFGGKPWGMIATTLANFYRGQTSLEVMLDTAYTLAHNNGPMFNKGMMFQMYTDKFLMILDVQRSGQVPELILSNHIQGFTAQTAGLRALLQQVRGQLPNAFGNYVDWHQVEALGSLKKYPSEKMAQDKMHPKPKVTAWGAPIIGEFLVMPGKAAHIYVRKSAA